MSLTTLKDRIRSRAQNSYGLDLTVKSKGDALTLTLRHKETGQTATEDVSVPPSDLNDLFDYPARSAAAALGS